MDGDATFGAGAVDILDVDTALLGLAHRRRGRVVLLRPPLAPFLAQLHSFVRGPEADVFDLVARRGADFFSDDFGDLFGDLAAADAAFAAIAAAVSFATATAATATPGTTAGA